MSIEIVAGELGDALLALVAGGAVVAMFISVLNYATAF